MAHAALKLRNFRERLNEALPEPVLQVDGIFGNETAYKVSFFNFMRSEYFSPDFAVDRSFIETAFSPDVDESTWEALNGGAKPNKVLHVLAGWPRFHSVMTN